jgi:diaminohydroxyphosphoribosylaminopyrimidine deaminase/5-amino-6-(5-phosphoribosylamino)uracil reductase
MNEYYLKRCIDLALKAHKFTQSNPMVGALIVHNDIIIGEGYHEKFGGPHAEVNAIDSVSETNKKFIQYSTMYVTLEPCNFFGKTPPCCNLILDNKIKRIVIGSLDPNPKVNGQGVEFLRSNGVDVEVVEMTECKDLIAKFEVNMRKQCYVILKFAKSFDHYMGHKAMQIPISGQVSKYYTHKLRTEVDGILIGANTALIDNPQLNARHFQGENPVRIILDSKLTVPKHHQIFQDGHRTIIINELENKLEGPVQYVKNESTEPRSILNLLYDLGIYSVMVEGGASILNFFTKNNLWHEARIITNKQKLLSKFKEEELVQAPNIDGILVNKTSFDEFDDMVIIKPKTSND